MCIHAGVCCSFSSLQTPNEVQMHWGRSSLHGWTLDQDAPRSCGVQFAKVTYRHCRGSSFTFIYLPIYSFFFFAKWLIRSLCLTLEIYTILGHKVCLFAGTWVVSVGAGFGYSGCLVCRESISRLDFLCMHHLPQLSLGYPKNWELWQTWLQINSRWPEQIGTKPFPSSSCCSPKQEFTWQQVLKMPPHSAVLLE